MAGALTSAGGSIWSQKSSNGSVDWGTVLRDGAVGAATGLIGGGASAAAAKATAGMANCLGKNILTGAVEGAIDGGASNGLQYLTSGQPITPAGFARAVGEGAGEGTLGGGAGGALSKVTAGCAALCLDFSPFAFFHVTLLAALRTRWEKRLQPVTSMTQIWFVRPEETYPFSEWVAVGL